MCRYHLEKKEGCYLCEGKPKPAHLPDPAPFKVAAGSNWPPGSQADGEVDVSHD